MKLAINNQLKSILLAFIAFKIVVLLLVFLGQFILPFAELNWSLNYLSPADRASSVFSVFITWDAQHYMHLADSGYAALQASNAFYPLFPWFIKIGKFFTFGNTALAGYLMANLFSLFALIFFYKLGAKLYNEKIAWRASLLLMAFPTSFLLHMMYSEPLFLMLTCMVFYALYHERYWLTAGLGLLVPLARAQGILLMPVLAWRVFVTHLKKKEYDKIALYGVVVSTSVIFGFFIYLFYMNAVAGHMFAGFHAQGHFVSMREVSALFHPLHWFIDNFITGPWSWLGVSTSVIHRVFFIFYLLMLPLVYRKCDSTLFIYTLSVGLVPALTSDLAGFPRYLLLAFPIFLALAKSLEGKLFTAVLIIFCLIQILLMQLHCLNYWFA